MHIILDWFVDSGGLYAKYFLSLPFCIGLLRFRSLSLGQQILLSLVLWEVLAEVLSVTFKKNNMPFLHIFTIGEFCLLTTVFYVGAESFLSQKTYCLLIGIFVLFAILNIIFYQGIWEVNSLSRSLEGILLILIALWYFRYLLQNLHTPFLGKSFMFWFATTVLLYFAANLLLFIFSSSIISSSWESSAEQSILILVWSMFNFMNLIMYLLFSIALLCKDPIRGKA